MTSHTYRHPLPSTGFAYDLAAGSIESAQPDMTLASSSSSSSAPSTSVSDDEDASSATSLDCASASAASKSRQQRVGEQWAPKAVEPALDGTDFLWMMTEEPHRTRRKAVLKAHPEVSIDGNKQRAYPLILSRLT